MAVQSKVHEATSANFQALVLSSQSPVVVDFWAPWCIWCKKLVPTYDSLSTTMESLKFAKVNVDEQRQLAQDYGISSLPTLKFFCGGREIGEIVGALPKEKLAAAFRRLIENHEECLDASSPMKSR